MENNLILTASRFQRIAQAQEALGFWGRDLDEQPDDLAWLWDGYLAPGNLTLLTSQWKSGKTTLISILLSRLREGGQLAGLSIGAQRRPHDTPATIQGPDAPAGAAAGATPLDADSATLLSPAPASASPASESPASPALVHGGRAIIVSEESPALWRRRHRLLNLSNVYFVCQPFRGKPSMDEWLALLERIAVMHSREPVDMAVIDTLTTFLPGRNEANAGVVMEALLPLRRWTDLGLSVLLAHHPAKGAPLAGQAARGSGALASFTDINLEMSFYDRGNTTDRRRRILAYSRYEETPRQLVLELNAAGTDYLVHGDFGEDEFTQNWERLRLVLEDAGKKRTRQELVADWPADFPCPSDATLARWLQRGVAAGLVCQKGTGRRSDPFRHWLPGQEEIWKKNPLYDFRQMLEEQEKTLAASGARLR